MNRETLIHKLDAIANQCILDGDLPTGCVLKALCADVYEGTVAGLMKHIRPYLERKVADCPCDKPN